MHIVQHNNFNGETESMKHIPCQNNGIGRSIKEKGERKKERRRRKKEKEKGEGELKVRVVKEVPPLER